MLFVGRVIPVIFYPIFEPYKLASKCSICLQHRPNRIFAAKHIDPFLCKPYPICHALGMLLFLRKDRDPLQNHLIH